MIQYKYCCDGFNAVRKVGMRPIKKKGVLWYRALYQCSKCGQYTVRGEGQKTTWNTFIRIINETTALNIIKLRNKYVQQKMVRTIK